MTGKIQLALHTIPAALSSGRRWYDFPISRFQAIAVYEEGILCLHRIISLCMCCEL
ncbi:MAG: hypothetical protein V8S95_10740 [Odoribacter sp.]